MEDRTFSGIYGDTIRVNTGRQRPDTVILGLTKPFNAFAQMSPATAIALAAALVEAAEAALAAPGDEATDEITAA